MVPASVLFAFSAIKYRSFKEVAGYTAAFMGGVFVVNEYKQWNKVSARLYISMKSDYDK